MRWDDLPQSDNIEDRRGDGGGGGGGGFPIGGGGLGIGTIVVLGLIGWALGIDPRLLIGGAEIITGGGQPHEQPSAAFGQAPARRATRWASSSADPRLRRRAVEADLRAERQALPRADAGDVHRRDARAMRAGRRSPRWGRSIARPTRGSISTRRSSARSSGASAAATSDQGLQIRAGLCDRARGRPSRAEPARHPAEAQQLQRGLPQGRGEPHPGQGRVAGRLLRRRLGEPRRQAVAI